MKHFGYTEPDFIACEYCGSWAVDIHHIEPRSKFGSKRKNERDDIKNLIALCRRCHDLAHGPESSFYKVVFKNIATDRN